MSTFGQYVRTARLEAGLSLREMARAMDVSHVFIAEVERGVRGLAREHWPRLLALLPSLDPERLERLERLRLPLRLDLTDKPAAMQELGLQFARRVTEANLTNEEIAALMETLVGKKGGES